MLHCVHEGRSEMSGPDLQEDVGQGDGSVVFEERRVPFVLVGQNSLAF